MMVNILINGSPNAPRNTNASDIKPLSPGKPIAAKNATVTNPV